jgi:hypothetical protein
MKNEKVARLGVTMGIIILSLLIVIFFGVYSYFPKINQKIDTLSARLDKTTPVTSTSAADAKLTEITPRLAELEKNYTTLVSVINTKMPNVNLPALLSIASAKGTPSANIALAIALIENEPTQAKTYLTNTLAFNDSEVIAVMGPMEKYNTKSKLFGDLKFLHRSHS